MIAALVMVLAFVVLVAVLIFIPRLLLKRAIRKVITRFRAQGATSPDKAKTLAELRLADRGPLGNMMRFRDYKQYAVRLLGQAEVILGTDEGGVYLSEDKLQQSPVKRFAKIQ